MTSDTRRESETIIELRETGLEGPVLKICAQFIGQLGWSHAT